jgi:hypothetical protein
VQHAHFFEALDIPFFLAGLEAAGAQVPPLDLAIAQGAQKTAAQITGDNGFFLRMIKATRFAFDHDRFGVSALSDLLEKGREDFYLQRRLARWARNQTRLIEDCFEQPRFALWAVEFGEAHWGKFRKKPLIFAN